MVASDVAAELPKPKKRRKTQAERAAQKAAMPKSAGFLKNVHWCVQEQLQASSALPTFLGTAGKLARADRLLLVEQALLLLELTYVHLPMKRAMYAIDPIQRLKLLQYRMSEMTDDQLPDEIVFHNEMTDIFNSTRDLHTNYLLPAPFNDKTAYLPFYLEEYYDEAGAPHYIVSKLATGFNHATFQKGVEVLYWNGTPIRRAIEVNANRQAGSNPEARFARGLDSLTTRPLVRSLPPDEEWVMVGYLADGKLLELRLDWLIFAPKVAASGVDPNAALSAAAYLAFDIQTSAINTAKRILYKPESLEAEELALRSGSGISKEGNFLATSLQNIFRAMPVTTQYGTFGYIRIFSFNVNDADSFLTEFVRLLHDLPQNGLIIDIRSNGGGLVLAAEGLLQLLTPRHILPESSQFINSLLTLNLCRKNRHSNVLDGLDLSPWVESIAQSVETGSTYSLAFPITDEAWANSTGQVYHGPVVLITDALCYSATDIFAAGFQDHEIGPILGTSKNTGAGGANVWTHSLLSRLLDGPENPFKPLPNGASMRVAVRRTLRNGQRAGYPLEDLGVVPNKIHKMTRDDVLNGNVDMIANAASLLVGLPVYELEASITAREGSKLRLLVTVANIDRLDVYLDGRPRLSRDLHDGKTHITLEEADPAVNMLDLHGFCGGKLVAARKIQV